MALSVQNVTKESIPSMSESETDDYNRGRKYLIDMAKQHDVPIFNDVRNAENLISEMMVFLGGKKEKHKRFGATFSLHFLFLLLVCYFYDFFQ